MKDCAGACADDAALMTGKCKNFIFVGDEVDGDKW